MIEILLKKIHEANNKLSVDINRDLCYLTEDTSTPENQNTQLITKSENTMFLPPKITVNPRRKIFSKRACLKTSHKKEKKLCIAFKLDSKIPQEYMKKFCVKKRFSFRRNQNKNIQNKKGMKSNIFISKNCSSQKSELKNENCEQNSCLPFGSEYLMIKDPNLTYEYNYYMNNSTEDQEIDDSCNDSKTSLNQTNSYLPLTFINLNCNAMYDNKLDQDFKHADVPELDSRQLKTSIYYKNNKIIGQSIFQDSMNEYSNDDTKKKININRSSNSHLNSQKSFKKCLLNCIDYNNTHKDISNILDIRSFIGPSQFSKERLKISNQSPCKQTSSLFDKKFIVKQNFGFLNKFKMQKEQRK